MTGTLNIKGLKVRVNVLKIKNEYGNIRYTVSPVTGSGTLKSEDVQLDKEFIGVLDNYIN